MNTPVPPVKLGIDGRVLFEKGRFPTRQKFEPLHGIVDQLEVKVADGRFVFSRKRICRASGLGLPAMKVMVLPLMSMGSPLPPAMKSSARAN